MWPCAQADPTPSPEARALCETLLHFPLPLPPPHCHRCDLIQSALDAARAESAAEIARLRGIAKEYLDDMARAEIRLAQACRTGHLSSPKDHDCVQAIKAQEDAARAQGAREEREACARLLSDKAEECDILAGAACENDEDDYEEELTTERDIWRKAARAIEGRE